MTLLSHLEVKPVRTILQAYKGSGGMCMAGQVTISVSSKNSCPIGCLILHLMPLGKQCDQLFLTKILEKHEGGGLKNE